MSEFPERILRAQSAMKERGVEAMCFSVGSDLPYLTGYRAMALERVTMFVVPLEGQATLIVPALEVPRVEIPDEAFSVIGWSETEDPIALIDSTLGDVHSVAFGDETWSRFLLQLQDANPARSYCPASDLMAMLRMQKSTGEIAALRQAAQTVDTVVEEMAEVTFSGRSEIEVAREFVERAISGGHDSMEFWIVASGPNGASPHHEPGDRIIAHGDAVVVDFGGRQDGYCSDTTRMFLVGDAPYGFNTAFDVLLLAQMQTVGHVKPGVTAHSVDALAREIITDAGYGELFIHRTGHGIGMDTHEHPYLVEGNDQILTEGMVFSIEPGIYNPGEWGMRIEDIVAVTQDGVERLNRSDRGYRVVS